MFKIFVKIRHAILNLARPRHGVITNESETYKGDRVVLLSLIVLFYFFIKMFKISSI